MGMIRANKGLVTALTLVLVALLVSACSKKTYQVERVIEAPPEAVWAVLMDTASYGDWNPVFVKVVGDYVEGQEVQQTFKDPSGKLYDVTNRVKRLVPQRELRQTGGMTGVLTFDHSWLLEQAGAATKVTQYEIDRGFYVWFWDDSWIIPSYTAVMDALEQQVMQRGN